MTRNPKASLFKLAGIQYVGIDGVSMSCHDAVKRLVQYGERIERARILTAARRHALLLTVEPEELVAVKPGFSSGYRGEGPVTFSAVLQLLEAAGAAIEEYVVAEEVLQRLGMSALTADDIDAIEAAQPVRPTRWYDYVLDRLAPGVEAVAALQSLRPVMPWAVLDERLVELARGFFANPDDCILTGFRRLEDLIRKRVKLEEHGAKLFSLAFAGDDSVLEWRKLDKGEQVGRAQLFTGAFMAFRNPRAHREVKTHERALLAEFLMLNQLYLLEREAVKRKRSAKAKTPPNKGQAPAS